MFSKRVESPEEVLLLLRKDADLVPDDLNSAFRLVTPFFLDRHVRGSEHKIWTHRPITAFEVISPSEEIEGYGVTVPVEQDHWIDERFYSVESIATFEDPLTTLAARAVYEVANFIDPAGHREQLADMQRNYRAKLVDDLVRTVTNELVLEQARAYAYQYLLTHPNSLTTGDELVKAYLDRHATSH